MLVAEPARANGAQQQGGRLTGSHPVGSSKTLLLAWFESRTGFFFNVAIVALSVGLLSVLGGARSEAQAIDEDRPGASVLHGDETETRPSASDLAALPQLADLDAALALRDSQASQRLRLSVGDRVFFAPDSTDLGTKAGLALFGQAHWLVGTGSKAVIVGHGDDGGSSEANLAIGLRRAVAVRNRLIDNGVPADRLRVVSAGRSQRIATCEEAYCRVHNRRAVIVIVRGFAQASAPQ